MSLPHSSTLRLSIMGLVVLPYVVAFSPNPADSSWTSVQVAVGTGSYADVSRDCNGKVLGVTNVPFQEGGASVDHYFSVGRIGAKAGVAEISEDRSYEGDVSSPKHTVMYFNPNIGLNTKYFGLDVGLVTFDHELPKFSSDMRLVPSYALRLGARGGFFLSTGLCDNLPLMSGGGLFDVGLGFNLGHPHSMLWLGLGGGPYDASVFSVKGEFPMRDNVMLDLRGLVGTGPEYGLSIGTKIIF